jgi:hypothetical protein
MPPSMFKSLTAEEEVRFRQWARDNWKPGDEICVVWHPIVRHEIATMEVENWREYCATNAE